MRRVADEERIRGFMQAVAREARGPVRIYLVGGTTAVLLGWRPSTVDIDLVMEPEDDRLLRALPALKEALGINVELASPAHFIPVPEGWQDRSRFIETIGSVSFYHYDLYAQAMAKLERRHRQDLADVEQMVARGLIEPGKARDYFARIEPLLHRYPAVHAPAFRSTVDEAFAG
jgi:hypothetical protein